jgi:dihydropyrimidine dehydrogenase (NAD+) subunit PreT
MEEASRCLLCLDAPCSAACPAKTDPAKFIRSVRFKNFKGAAETIRTNNPLGSICARVCPTERYCEKACSRCGIDNPINIGAIQRFVTDFEQACGMEILEAGKPNGKKVAIIGSGPAGLSAAAFLAQKGFAAEIFEKSEKAGGYLRYGIPEYRLPNSIVDYEIARIEKLGVKINTNCEIKSVAELSQKYDAVLIATGFSKGKNLAMFDGCKNVCTATKFLKEAKSKSGKIELPDNVLVIGGGDVAMDTVTTLRLLGVKHVTDVVYETFDEFRASRKELRTSQENNVSIIDGFKPVAVNGNEVSFQHRYTGAELKVKADMIILAIGQENELDKLSIPSEKGEVKAEGNRMGTSNIFFAGDIGHAEKTVVYAVGTAKQAAADIAEYLGGK